jgi:hypothetical protein
MRPLISVLVPVYNREKYLEQCLGSVRKQLFGDFEIVCCDNASTDQSWQFMQDFAAKDSRVRVFRNDRNLGPVPNWRRCLEEARGRYIHWLWSDDWVDDEFYSYLLSRMNAENAGMVICPAKFIHDDGFAPIHYACNQRHIKGMDCARAILNSWTLPRSPAAALLPADAVRRHFYGTLPTAADLDPASAAIGPDSLMIVGAATECERVAISDRPLVNFRQHQGSLSVRATLLNEHYLLAHLWFARQKRIRFTMRERVGLFRACFRSGGGSRTFALLNAWWKVATIT